MQKLLAFIVAKRHWFLLILCEIISFVLIYQNNAYQRNRMLNSANVITGSLLSVSNTVFSYFDLQKVNQELLEQNSRLEMDVVRLYRQLNDKIADTITFDRIFLQDSVLAAIRRDGNDQHLFIPAGIVRNSTRELRNYITINKGVNDGIRPDMGVVSPRGVVGIVTTVNDRFAIVMSLLHVQSRVSCKLQHTNYFGALSWRGGDAEHAFLEQIPTHATFQTGDTIVTSGFTGAFPPGMMVGVVESFNKQDDDNSYTLKVRLAVDFQSLNALCVIDNPLQKEQVEIEREARRND